MPHMSSDQLRDISVAVVEDFVNNKTPLSVGLAKQAALHELNSEQIQRCVEASNTIAHLKLLSVAEDRTFEFPLCKFAEVMSHAAAPDFEKSAGTMISTRSASRATDLSQEKHASDDSTIEISEHEAKLHFIKEAAANDRAVEELEARASIVKAELIKAASAVAKDPHGLDKIACVVEPENAIALTQLAYGEYRTLRDFGAGKDGLFKAAELKTVATFQDLYKEARALVNELNERKALQKRAHAVREELQKEAILGAAGSLVGGAVGRVIGGTLGAAGRGVVSAGRTIFQAGGKTLGAEKYKKVGLGATALAAGGTAAMNASMLGHNPGVNPVNGRSRDVWDGLQSN